jgi:hypothetical protein
VLIPKQNGRGLRVVRGLLNSRYALSIVQARIAQLIGWLVWVGLSLFRIARGQGERRERPLKIFFEQGGTPLPQGSKERRCPGALLSDT